MCDRLVFQALIFDMRQWYKVAAAAALVRVLAGAASI
jgi:hypothetical protein